MIFDQFNNDIIAIISPDGSGNNIKANVQSRMAFIYDTSIKLEDGSEIIRNLPNGVTESYIVLDNGYRHGGNGLPAGYQAKIKKKSLIEATKPHISNVNINAIVTISLFKSFLILAS